MNKFRYLWPALLILGLVWLFLSRQEPKNELWIGDKKVKVEIAKTAAEKIQGLSDRESLCWDCGLLFVYEKAGFYPFWMKRMHFDLDIIWIADGQVVDITQGAIKPQSDEFEAPKQIYQSALPCDQVLEVNAGWVEEQGIKVGDRVRLVKQGYLR